MFSKTQIALLFVAAIASVQGFAPVAQPKVASSTELGAFFFQKPSEESTKPMKKVVAKKAPAKKIVAKKTTTFKNDFVAKKPEKNNKKLTIYERQCHIN